MGEKKKRVLIVDDEPAWALALKFVLQEEGYEVRIRDTIEEAREAIWKAPPDFIVLDTVFPNNPGAGVEFLRELKAMPSPICDIPVIMYTVRGEAEIECACLEAGAEAFIRKMAASEEIVGVMRQLEKGKPSVRVSPSVGRGTRMKSVP
jgi:DNA-binding response OmpR family regulator